MENLEMEAFILLNNAIRVIPSQPNAPTSMEFYWDYYNYEKRKMQLQTTKKKNWNYNHFP
jgi:hypothetical protein